MKENDFQTDTQKQSGTAFSQKMGALLSVSVLLTGIFSVSGVYFFIQAVRKNIWVDMGASGFAWKTLIYVCTFCVFISLVRIALDEKFFSQTLTVCVRLIGGLFLTAAVLFPRLPDYQSSGFEIFKWNSFVLMDGMILIPGMLFLILGGLMKAGFEMQREMDGIL